MSEDCSDLCLPQDAVVSTLGAMKNFPKNELVNYVQLEASLKELFDDVYVGYLHVLNKSLACLRVRQTPRGIGTISFSIFLSCVAK